MNLQLFIRKYLFRSNKVKRTTHKLCLYQKSFVLLSFQVFWTAEIRAMFKGCNSITLLDSKGHFLTQLILIFPPLTSISYKTWCSRNLRQICSSNSNQGNIQMSMHELFPRDKWQQRIIVLLLLVLG